ncbi:lactonase family protein [Paenibacillus planticolens]|uniref:Beta-propeller fold lactonase family protein n=1 Tax=Paenibacillus planticolens TaxID=2654976 RepID=A0ABX1ZX12_9BACL|nr:lactonase family protein [Paenibacillus planticolens]NOV04584.1 beta-propeller fold lactonase family protein [Paenibacillus planticolens]
MIILPKHHKTLAFIGSYADSGNPGVYTCQYGESNGSLEVIHEISGLQNPTFLSVDQENWRLFALSEGIGADGQRCGAAVSYDIDKTSGKLALLNSEITLPMTTCHIQLDHTNQVIMVSSYHGGMVGLSPVLADGRIGQSADIQQHQGASVLEVQDRPRAHSVFLDRTNTYVGVCDLGLDKIKLYKLDLAAQKLHPHGEVSVAPGSGPRHFAFHPTYKYGYVINELGSTVTAFSYDEEQGSLAEIQTVSTLPDAYEGENACADIHVSPDGKYLYGSNRGHDSIVVYAIDAGTGKLAPVEYAPTLGKHPRNFAISPDGSHLLVANKDSDNIVSFARNAETGKLVPTGSVLTLSKPVCIKFAVVE